MPSYEVTDKVTGKTLELTGDSPPTDQELTDIFSGYHAKPTSAKPASILGLPRYGEVEKRISERPSALETLQKEMQTPFDFAQHPIKSTFKPAITALKAANVPLQQGIINPLSNLAMEEQEGTGIMPRLRAVKEGFTGERPGTPADVLARAGTPDIIAEPLGFLVELGAGNVSTAGKLLGKPTQAIRAKVLENKDMVLNKAKEAVGAIQKVKDNLGIEVGKFFRQYGNTPVNLKRTQTVIDKLPKSAISRIKRAEDIVYESAGVIKATASNLHNLRLHLDDIIHGDWTRYRGPVSDKARIQRAYRMLGKIIERSDKTGQLRPINRAYSEFMRKADPVLDQLLDPDRHVVTKKVLGLFKPSGERAYQKAFENLYNDIPELNKLYSSVVHANRVRAVQTLGQSIGSRALTGAAIYGGIKAAGGGSNVGGCRSLP